MWSRICHYAVGRRLKSFRCDLCSFTRQHVTFQDLYSKAYSRAESGSPPYHNLRYFVVEILTVIPVLDPSGPYQTVCTMSQVSSQHFWSIVVFFQMFHAMVISVRIFLFFLPLLHFMIGYYSKFSSLNDFEAHCVCSDHLYYSSSISGFHTCSLGVLLFFRTLSQFYFHHCYFKDDCRDTADARNIEFIST